MSQIVMGAFAFLPAPLRPYIWGALGVAAALGLGVLALSVRDARIASNATMRWASERAVENAAAKERAIEEREDAIAERDRLIARQAADLADLLSAQEIAANDPKSSRLIVDDADAWLRAKRARQAARRR